MKTELVVLRKVNEDVLIFNFTVNPRKWANVTEGALYCYTDSFGRSYAFNWDVAQIEHLLPDAYRNWLVLRSWYQEWYYVRYQFKSFFKWILLAECKKFSMLKRRLASYRVGGPGNGVYYMAPDELASDHQAILQNLESQAGWFV